jgi:FkbM family methyltransferase
MRHFNPMTHRIPVLKRWVPSLRKRLARLSWTGGFRVVECHGALFLVNWRNFVDRQIAFYGAYEGPQLAWLRAAMARHGLRTFIDVGANFGLYSAILARGGEVDRVIAFEPDPRNVSQFHATLFLNRLHDMVTLHPVAVSDRAGTVSFLTFAESSTGQSRVAVAGDSATVEVPAVSLDGLLALRGERLALKIDVERHEGRALAGMAGLLGGNRCLVQIEVSDDTLEEVRRCFTRLGYRQVHRIDDDVYFTNCGLS